MRAFLAAAYLILAVGLFVLAKHAAADVELAHHKSGHQYTQNDEAIILYPAVDCGWLAKEIVEVRTQYERHLHLKTHLRYKLERELRGMVEVYDLICKAV